MSKTDRKAQVAALLQRFTTACDLKMVVDRARIEDAMLRWFRGISATPMRVSFVADAAGVRETARDARDARAARDAWDAWAAWDATYLSITAIGAADRGDLKMVETWTPMLEAFEAGAFSFWVTADELRVATVPQRARVDSARRLHAEDGPAFAWLNDIRDYYWHGVHVAEHVVMAPDRITYAEIANEKNAEVRRVLIERFGEDRYIAESGMKPVARDEVFGDLYVEPFETGRPIAKLHVTNRSAEPDGTFRRYWLSVNPALYGGEAGRIPQAAAASTWRTTPGGKELFFKRWQDYAPVLET